MIGNKWRASVCAILASLGGYLFTPPSAVSQQRSARQDWSNHPINEWVRQSPQPDIPAPAFGCCARMRCPLARAMR